MSTHNITVNFRNCDHWHWSLDGGADSMVMTGNTAGIDAPEGGTLVVKGVDANHVVLATDTTELSAIATTGVTNGVLHENGDFLITEEGDFVLQET